MFTHKTSAALLTSHCDVHRNFVFNPPVKLCGKLSQARAHLKSRQAPHLVERMSAPSTLAKEDSVDILSGLSTLVLWWEWRRVRFHLTFGLREGTCYCRNRESHKKKQTLPRKISSQ